MDHRYDDRTAQLPPTPQTVAEPIPSPRPRPDLRAHGQDPYPAPQQPRFTPRIQYTPRIQFPPQPTFTPSPTRPMPRSGPAQPASQRPAPAQPVSPRQSPKGYERRPGRAIIGDELRIPILWCDFGSCVAHYTHVDALGERDLRLRALTAGWCYDLLGRLACPSCVQRDPTFWMTRPPVPLPRL